MTVWPKKSLSVCFVLNQFLWIYSNIDGMSFDPIYKIPVVLPLLSKLHNYSISRNVFRFLQFSVSFFNSGYSVVGVDFDVFQSSPSLWCYALLIQTMSRNINWICNEKTFSKFTWISSFGSLFMLYNINTNELIKIIIIIITVFLYVLYSHILF